MKVTVKTLKTGVHSGASSGIVPSAYRIMQHLISRLEDARTGEVLVPELHTNITPTIYSAAAKIATLIGPYLPHMFPFEGGVHPMSENPVELLLNGSWRPTLTVIGCEGLPIVKDAGNVIQPFYTTKLSFRIPPGVDKNVANDAVVRILQENPPYGAIVEVVPDAPDAGWVQKDLEPWLDNAMQEASQQFFNNPALTMWEGASIPFMAMLGELFPNAQFMITGILGHDSNAHGINENFSIEYLKKLLCCIAYVVGIHGSK